jgi:hypothetical protein
MLKLNIVAWNCWYINCDSSTICALCCFLIRLPISSQQANLNKLQRSPLESLYGLLIDRYVTLYGRNIGTRRQFNVLRRRKERIQAAVSRYQCHILLRVVFACTICATVLLGGQYTVPQRKYFSRWLQIQNIGQDTANVAIQVANIIQFFKTKKRQVEIWNIRLCNKPYRCRYRKIQSQCLRNMTS